MITFVADIRLYLLKQYNMDTNNKGKHNSRFSIFKFFNPSIFQSFNLSIFQSFFPLWKFCAVVTLLYGVTFLFAEFYDNPFSGAGDLMVLLFQWAALEFAVFGLIYLLSVSRRVFAVVFPLLTVVCSVIAYFRCTIHLTLTADLVELAFINDLGTTADMITPWLVAVMLTAAAASAVIVRQRFKINDVPCRWLHALMAAVMIVLPLNIHAARAAVTHRMPYSLYFAVKECLNNRRSMQEERPPFTGSAVCHADSLTVVFVIGESLRAASMQINGYSRATTPLLCKEVNAVSMSNIYTDYNLTHLSIPHFMTRSDEQHPDRAYTERSFISLMKRAGYSTAWLSNQESEKTFVYFMNECDRLEYVSGGKVSYIFDKWLDTDLLPYYDKELARDERRKLIVLHTIGSHWYYNTHFTPEFEKFRPVTDSRVISSNTTEQMRNSYDNTVLYSDHFWHELIKRLRSRNAILIYLSDHAECMGENGQFIHGGNDSEPQHLPGCFVWYSDIYARRYPEKIKALRRNKDKRFKSYFVFHSVLDAADIKSGYIEQQRNIFYN